MKSPKPAIRTRFQEFVPSTIRETGIFLRVYIVSRNAVVTITEATYRSEKNILLHFRSSADERICRSSFTFVEFVYK